MGHSYLWLKALHILGVILFIGNIIVTGWWKNMADLTRNPQIIAFAQRQVTLTDFIFTAGGVAILFVAGALNVWLHDIMPTTRWIVHGFTLFTLSGLIWALVLIPTQIQQAKMAKQFATDGLIPERYWTLCKRWNYFGALATVLPLINLYWMVFKPT